MALLTRFLVFLQRLLDWALAPIYFLRSWRNTPRERLPPIKNPILKLSATQLAERIRSRQLGSEEVVRAYVERIREVNKWLNAVVEERFEEALEEARGVDQLLKAGAKSTQQLLKETPLLGVPITVKESCSVKGMSFCVGSLSRRDAKADEDGESVAHMRRAGAIILAVTTTPEMCLSFATINLVTGRTNNPYDFLRTSGGSSGGAAALLGAGASVISPGSDLAGSIRIPCHFSGIFGHKPTPGYVPVRGHYPFSEDRDFQKFLVVGPLTRYAEDLRLSLKIMAGDAASELRLDDPVDVRKMKVFYQEEGQSFPFHPVKREIKNRLKEAADYLQKTHDVPAEKVNFTELADSLEMACSLLFGMEGIPNLLQDPNNPENERSLLLEIIKGILGKSQISLHALTFTLFHKTNLFIPRSKYQMYRTQVDALRQKFKNVLKENAVFLYPTYPCFALYHNQVYSNASSLTYTMIFNVLQLPSTSVPLGLSASGLPIGIQVVAAPHQDRLCLAIAEELEKGFGGWVHPPSS